PADGRRENGKRNTSSSFHTPISPDRLPYSCLTLRVLGTIRGTRTRPRIGASVLQRRLCRTCRHHHRHEGGPMHSSPNPALEASVLVLNKLFMAIHIISVRRAFVLLCKDLAEVVSLEDGTFATYDFATWREVSEYRARHFRQEDDDWIRTPTTELQVPRVL